MNFNVKESVEYEGVKNHVLTQYTDGKIKSFYLHKPSESGEMETRMMSTLFIFSREGIIITGDLAPNRHGLVGSLGYGLDWFKGKKSQSYLAEKFLDKGHYEEERARVDFRDFLQEYLVDQRRDGDVSPWLIEARDRWYATLQADKGWPYIYNERAIDFSSGDLLYEDLSRTIPDVWDHQFGIDYKTSEFRWLVVLQTRFAEAYEEWEQKQKTHPSCSECKSIDIQEVTTGQFDGETRTASQCNNCGNTWWKE